MSLLTPSTPVSTTPTDDGVAEIYVAVVLRHDGPVPGLCSMLHLGLAVAGVDTDGQFRSLGQFPATTLALKPVGPSWTNSTFSTLMAERERLESAGEEVGSAITRATQWINSQCARLGIAEYRVVPVIWPGTYDAAHILHYFTTFNGLSSPFTQSSRHTPEELFASCAEARRQLTSPTSPRTTPVKSVRQADALDSAPAGR